MPGSCTRKQNPPFFLLSSRTFLPIRNERFACFCSHSIRRTSIREKSQISRREVREEARLWQSKHNEEQGQVRVHRFCSKIIKRLKVKNCTIRHAVARIIFAGRIIRRPDQVAEGTGMQFPRQGFVTRKG